MPDHMTCDEIKAARGKPLRGKLQADVLEHYSACSACANDFKPPEIWVVRVGKRSMVGPALDDDGTNSFLAWPSQEEATRGLEFQRSMGWYMDAELSVVRLA